MKIQNIIGMVLTSACYIGLLLVFSYTSLFFEVIVKGNEDLLAMFNNLQSSWPVFIVNIGLLLMLLIDYVYNKSYVARWSLIMSIVAFGILVVVHYFAGHAAEAKGYNLPFCWPWFGVALYSLFIIYLGVLKCYSLPHLEVHRHIKETYNN